MTARKAQTAEPAAEAPKPTPTKVGNADKRLIRSVMCDRLEAITAAELKEAQPGLVDYDDELLLGQVNSYLKYLLPEIVKEREAK